MNRFTLRLPDDLTADLKPGYGWCEIAERLAAYEDTGLEPEQCAKYAQAEKEGHLVVLPCKVGDTIYAPTRNFISEFRVSQFDFAGYVEPCLWVEWYLIKGITGNFRTDGIRASEIGKTVFLTREEAKRALAAMDRVKKEASE